MDRFVMEFETGLIKSRFLVHSVAHGLECGNPFIVMDYCPKGNLTQYMDRYPVDPVKVGRESFTAERFEQKRQGAPGS